MIDLDHMAAHPIGALSTYDDLAEVSTVAPFLLDYNGLLPLSCDRCKPEAAAYAVLVPKKHSLYHHS